MDVKQVDVLEKGKELFDIDNAAFNRDFDLKARTVKEETDYLKNCEVYIAYENEKPIGLVGYETKEDFVEILLLAVIPEYQKKGLGRKLMSFAMDKIKDKEIRLVTHPKNTPAIILYLKSGFEISGWKDNYYGDGQPRLLFKLSLKK